MICDKCAHAAAWNRDEFDNMMEHLRVWSEHPTNCGCPCMHKMPDQWEKQFLTERVSCEERHTHSD